MSAIINPMDPITLYRVRIDLMSESGEQRSDRKDRADA